MYVVKKQIAHVYERRGKTMEKTVTKMYCDLCGKEISVNYLDYERILFYKSIACIQNDGSLLMHDRYDKILEHLCEDCYRMYSIYLTCIVNIGTNIYYLCKSDELKGEHKEEILQNFRKELEELDATWGNGAFQKEKDEDLVKFTN